MSPTSYSHLFLSMEVQTHSLSPTFHFHLLSKLLSMASYSGELLLDSSSPWSGVSIPLPFIFKKQRTPLIKKIQGLQAPKELHHAVSRASSSRWCSFASSTILFGQFTLIPCSSSYFSMYILHYVVVWCCLEYILKK